MWYVPLALATHVRYTWCTPAGIGPVTRYSIGSTDRLEDEVSILWKSLARMSYDYVEFKKDISLIIILTLALSAKLNHVKICTRRKLESNNSSIENLAVKNLLDSVTI
ncbi:hypothetical protein TNCV_897011 [Trichonephila clavipes]|nr:hypothetical protein TNCV_897011 [Trichonephila clavipes]